MTGSAEPRSSNWPAAVVIVVLLLGGLAFFIDNLGDDSDGGSESIEAVTLTKAELRKLEASSTETTIKRAPKDEAQQRPTDGAVVHPKRLTPVFDSPGGEPFAKIRKNQFGPTWLPVIEKKSGWLKVMLPSRPNASTGWIQDQHLRHATTPYLIRVHTGSRTLELFENDQLVDQWTVAVGAPETPTPSGRTFLLGQFTDPNQSYSPVIIPLGMHSDTLDSYGGGPGTVAFHGWTDPSVFGNAISHGCVRVPDEALAELRAVPLGTTVLIDGD